MKTTVFVLALLAAGAEAAPSSNVPAPTPPAPEAFSETRFGQTLSDPYRWFERDARAADLASWVKAASSHTVAELGALPERAQFARVLEQTTRAGVRYSDLQSAGAFLFYQRLEPADRVPTLVVRHEGVERVLLDPTAGTSEVAAIGNYSLSRDGRTVAVHVARGGAETGEIRLGAALLRPPVS
jgi:prolyl oligopeptidase